MVATTPDKTHSFLLLPSHPFSSTLRHSNTLTTSALHIATTSSFQESPRIRFADQVKFDSVANAEYDARPQPTDLFDTQQRQVSQSTTSSSNGSTSAPSLETWKRRLVTKEDKYHIHKITGIGFMFASTMIMAGGVWTKFTSIPRWLHGATLLLVWSGWLQLYTSITMTRQFRSRTDEKAAFLVTAIGSSMTNLLALWFSPFCPNVFLRHAWLPHGIVALNTLCLWLPMWSFLSHPKDTIQNRQDLKATSPATMPAVFRNWKLPSFASAQQLRDTFAYFVQIPIINLAASRMILQLHARGRDFFLTSWILPGTPAQNMANIFYSMVFLSMASNYVALTATLRDKLLISQATESKVMAALGAVSVFLLTRTILR